MKSLHEIRSDGLHAIQNAFAQYGRFIGRHVKVAITLPILLTLVSGLGALNLQINDNIKDGYTSSDAPSRIEERRWNAFTHKDGSKPYVSGLFVKEKGEGRRSSMIKNLTNLDEVLRLQHYVREEIVVDDWSFSRACHPYCAINEPLSIVRFALYGPSFGVTSENTLKLMAFGHLLGDAVNLTYPQASIAGMNVNLAFNIYGVSFKNGSSQITDAELLALWFRADVTGKAADLKFRKFESLLLTFINEYNGNSSNALEIVPLADHMVNEEVLRGGLATVPFFIVGFAIMFTFVVFTVHWSFIYNKCGSNAREPGMLLVCLIAVISPCMASGTAIGTTLLLGQPINVMMLVIPILILAVGVDDAFLLIHSWREHKYLADAKSTASNYGTHRLSLTFGHIGVSVTLTSLTNAIAFGIGALMPAAELRRFCVVAAAAITIDWIYQLSFFAAILKCACQSHDHSQVKDYLPVKQGEGEKEKRLTSQVPSYIKLYARWLLSWSADVVWVVVVALYLTSAIYGVYNMKADMDPTSLVPADSILAKAHPIHAQYVWLEYNPMVLIVQPSPDLTKRADFARLFNLLHQLESLPNSNGREGTMLWINDYLAFKRLKSKISGDFFMDMSDFYEEGVDMRGTYSDYYDYEEGVDDGGDEGAEEGYLNLKQLPHFLQLPQYAHWNESILWHRDHDGVKIDGFFAVLSYKNLSTIGDQAILTTRLREIVASDSLNATIFSLAGVVCVFFIAYPFPIVIAIANVSSICVGVLGYLHWWGVSLNPITMAFTIMAVGFSVDYAAHLCYHYATHNVHSDKHVRLSTTLHSIGVPMVQAGISTALCMLTQWYAQLLAFQVLVKTVLLVVVLGLLHGLFILPVMLTFIPKRREEKNKVDDRC